MLMKYAHKVHLFFNILVCSKHFNLIKSKHIKNSATNKIPIE